ncbi:hypothetical protein LX32DRAFT_79341 [Colletotrichum zoysiae]|uniref:Uncharacterized protein n=1 Tax=Colletotrichum zoysiae TaxID=1216348 RepID=A0AAD9LXN3_9PEZI|nr:hypothetical protein LX32DRAFT_79341 [Colletotrichum zoysiae]
MALVYYPRTGLAIASAFLVCNTVYLILEYTIPKLRNIFTNQRFKNWITIAHYLIIPSFIVLLGAILIPFLFLGKQGHAEACNRLTIDADIAGLGIRIAAWAQICILLLIALLGTFYVDVKMAKEVGAGLAVTHLSLAIALLIHIHQGGAKVSLADKILGSMILDAQNIALSIPLVTKETLAARWQVVVTVVCQTFGLILLGIIVNDFGNGNINITDCPCLSAAWWGEVGACRKSPASTLVRHEMKAFWIYYACRWLSLFQSSFHSLMNMEKFHTAEKDKSLHLKDLTFPRLYLESKSVQWRRLFRARSSVYDSYASTVSPAFLLYAMFAIVSMAAAENLLRDLGTLGGKEISFGQAVAIVIAAATIVRGLWLSYKMLQDRGVVNPPLQVI